MQDAKVPNRETPMSAAEARELLNKQLTKVKRFSIGELLGRLVKRLFDLVAAFSGLLILSPFFALIAIFIRRDSPGPVFFWCPRMGKGEKPFKMLKFRTMYECPSSYQGPPVTSKNDERITPFGHWLRDTKINELPQLWNVLIGEMSLVGPRPEDVKIARDWTDEVRQEILSVQPGITSPASIVYHGEENLLTRAHVMEEYFKNILPDKMRLDRLYVRNHSFSSDLDTIFWTLVIFIPRMVVAKIPEGYLFAGPISRLVNRFASWFLYDLITSSLAVVSVSFLWRTQDPLNWGYDHMAVLTVALALLFSGLNAVSGLNRIVWSTATVEDGLSLLLTSTTATVLVLAADLMQARYHWFDHPALPLVMILTIGLVAQIGFVATRYRLRLVTSFASRWLNWRRDVPGIGERVLIVGSGEGCQMANWLLKRSTLHNAFQVVGLIDDDIPTQHGMRLDGCLVLGRIADLPDLVQKYDVGIILFSNPDIPQEIKNFTFNLCQKSGVRLAFLGNLMEMVSQQLTQPVTALEYSLWSEDQIKFLALHDQVTGLPNRYLFQDRLVHSLAYAKRYKTKPVVMFIYLDGFVPAGDTLITKQFDEAMKETTRRLIQFKRESDTLARLDRYEFGLILEHVSDENATVSVAERITSAISQPIKMNGNLVNLKVDISFCDDLDDCGSAEVYRNTDIEKYYNKRKMIQRVEK